MKNRGRPIKAKDERLSKTYNLRFKQQDYDELTEKARKRGMTLGEFIRSILSKEE